MRRVVVTGMAGVTPLGDTWDEISAEMEAGRTGVRYIDAWDKLGDLKTRLGAPSVQFEHEKVYPRKKMRSMGRVAALGVRSAERALEHAGLLDDPRHTSSTGAANMAPP